MATYQQHPSSYRDPSGFVFQYNNKLYRQINKSYSLHYELLMESRLYHRLAAKKLLVKHDEVDLDISKSADCYKIIVPEFIPFISYPYEWSFGQLQDAALLTLDIMLEAMESGLVLKDATPYNVQFNSGKAIFIDTLSFEKYNESLPWIAYRQFCEGFLFPLVIARYTNLEVHKLLTAYPQGIDARTTASLLPGKARWRVNNWLHIYLAASISPGTGKRNITFSRSKLLSLVHNLKSFVQSLKAHTAGKRAWTNYYEGTILSKEYLQNKEQCFLQLLEQVNGNTAIDLGCNEGWFSRLLSKKMNLVIAVDADSITINNLYKEISSTSAPILPLCIDLANPPGEGGFRNAERRSFTERMDFDLALALALVHHLRIVHNISFQMMSDLFATAATELIIEFVPKEDAKVQQLLREREDIFSDYTPENFENCFRDRFEIIAGVDIPASSRRLYLMKTKAPNGR